jgi:hypothetical protein
MRLVLTNTSITVQWIFRKLATTATKGACKGAAGALRLSRISNSNDLLSE